MKILPYTLLIAVALISCQDSKKKVLLDLQALLMALEEEKEYYQATLTSINETHKAMISQHAAGLRAGETSNQDLANMVIPHKRLSLDYEEALKNYLNLIPQLKTVIRSVDDDQVVALSLENSYNQILGQKDEIKIQMDELKTVHERYRKQFEEIRK